MWLNRAWVLWLFAVIAIYPIPHTIALRNLILLIGALGCIWYFVCGSKPYKICYSSKLWPIWASLGALTIWMPIETSLFGLYPSISFSIWRSDWLNGLLVGAMGFYLAYHLEYKKLGGASAMLLAIVLALATHMLVMLCYQMYMWPTIGMDAFGLMPFAERDYHTGLCIPLIAIVLGEGVARATQHPGLLNITKRQLCGLLILALIATITIRSRNGLILAVLLIMGAGFYIAKMRQLLSWKGGSVVVLTTLALCVGLAFLAFKLDPRWARFGDSIEIALDIHGNQTWLYGGRAPLAEDGEPVDTSAYDRIAWAAAAIEQIKAHPMGVGYGYKAFGWAVNDAYKVRTGHESSHSGILDFTLANGWLGLFLWLTFVSLLVRYGWQLHSAAGYSLALHTLAWFGRIVLDGHFSGFRLGMFALITGVLIAASLVKLDRNALPST